MRIEIESTLQANELPNTDEAELAAPDESVDIGKTLERAVFAAQNGDRNKARVLLFQVTEAQPSNIDAWLWLASVSEYPEELLGFLAKALQIDPQNERARQWERATRSLLAKTFVQRGEVANADGQPEFAAQCFDQALEYDLSSETAWLGKSSLSPTAEEKELCLARVLNINPDNRQARHALDEISLNRSSERLNAARVAAFAGEVDAAEELVSSILSSEPENAAAWRLRSQLVASFAEKLAAYTAVLELAPHDEFARSAYEYLVNERALAEAAISETTSTEDLGLIEPPETQVSTAEVLQQALAPEPVDVEEINAELALFESPDHLEMEVAEPEDALDEFRCFDADGAFELSSLRSEIPDLEPNFHELEDDPDLFDANVSSTDMPHVLEPETSSGMSTDRAVSSYSVPCAFCGGDNDPHAFSCRSCCAVLTISDIDSLFSPGHADIETIQDAVTRMEAEWNLRDFSDTELVTLGLGHFNLLNFDQGMACFHDALSLNPNNVVLAGQVNAFAIRLSEMRRQEENRGALPKGKTILVVDDSATVRKLLSSKLEKSGHHVICAADGVDAMEIIETTVPDLVLLDIAMPRMDGYSVCKLIRASEAVKDVPVIMISGKDGFFDKVRGRMAGTTGYITKPFGPEALMKALDTYLLPDVVDLTDDVPAA